MSTESDSVHPSSSQEQALRIKDEPPLFLAAASSSSSTRPPPPPQQQQQHQKSHLPQLQQPHHADDASSGADTPSDDLHRLSDLDGLDQSFQAAESAAQDSTHGDQDGKNSAAATTTTTKRTRHRSSEGDHYSKEELRLIESFLETSVEMGGDDDDGVDDPLERVLEKVLEDGAEAVSVI